MTHILSSLPPIQKKRAKRLGRGTGSGAGAKSGRGTTRHQTARGDMPIHFEGGQNRLVKKFPLLRGKLRNKSVAQPVFIISLTQLQTLSPGEVVDMTYMKSKKAFGYRDNLHRRVKVVANGTLTNSLTVVLPVTRAAKTAILKAGGTVK